MEEDLECQCLEELPPLARLAIKEFNNGDYFAQHEHFEELWRQEPRAVRALYQGVLQVGLAYYQIIRGNYTGAEKMLKSYPRYLADLPDVCQGVDVARVRRDAEQVERMLERLGPERIGNFDRSLLKSVRLVENKE